MKRTRAAILAVAGAALGVLTLRVLRNRGSTTDDEDEVPADGATAAAEDSDTRSASGPDRQAEPTTAAERTPRIRPADPQRDAPAGDPDGTPRIRSEGPDRPPVPEGVDRTPRIRPREPARKPRLRKAGKGWIRR